MPLRSHKPSIFEFEITHHLELDGIMLMTANYSGLPLKWATITYIFASL